MTPPLIHLSADDMKTLLTGHQVTAPLEGEDVTLECDASDDGITHLEVITRAARSFLHGDDWDAKDLGTLADVLGEEHADVEALVDALPMHMARPGVDDEHCGVCGQPVQRMPKPNSTDFIYIHLDSGTAMAPNPPGRDGPT